MKKYIITTLCLGIFLVSSCNKDISIPELDPLIPASLDATGGTWKTIESGDITTYNVPKPAAATDAAYLAEIAELKQNQTSLTADQKAKITYWAAGGVVRWNEIARELAANYNTPPAPNADGTYPVPNAANPLADPKFPFANPPYASRAFALLSVAQYDALVAAWYYKYKFNRKAPYRYDTTIQNTIPGSDLPSYPSEDAVVASASLELLKLLFPGEVDYLKAKAEEHKNARLLAGVNAKSDIAIGDSLGRWVAQKIIARAKADGMGTAGSTAALPAKIAEIEAKGEIAWKSLEAPVRPGQVANFGKVKTWNMDAAGLVAVRPTPPPAQSSAAFKTDLDEVRGYYQSLTREQQRIANFWGDGVGSYTPPGHWNRTASDLIVKNKLSYIKAARALALMNTAIMDAGVSCWDTKYFYMTPRPSQMDASIKSTLGVPNFPSYTSGHSTFSAAAATVLSYIFPSETTALEAQAKEASESRIYGAIHYRFDCETGLVTGKKIGQMAVDRGKKDGSN